MDRIIEDIRKERGHQDEKHGGTDHDDSHYPGDWCLILAKYLGRASAVTMDAESDAAFRESMVKVAAVAVAAIESFDRSHS